MWYLGHYTPRKGGLAIPNFKIITLTVQGLPVLTMNRILVTWIPSRFGVMKAFAICVAQVSMNNEGSIYWPSCQDNNWSSFKEFSILAYSVVHNSTCQDVRRHRVLYAFLPSSCSDHTLENTHECAWHGCLFFHHIHSHLFLKGEGFHDLAAHQDHFKTPPNVLMKINVDLIHCFSLRNALPTLALKESIVLPWNIARK